MSFRGIHMNRNPVFVEKKREGGKTESVNSTKEYSLLRIPLKPE